MSRETRPPSPRLDSAGRQSPALSLRPPRRRFEDESKQQDKAWRKYAAGIERALALFDAPRLEWPDFISFLGRLSKAIQASATPNPLPHKSTIASRLAQCLNPSLPSGVHQKALEVYDQILGAIGADGRSRDLRIYLPGLSAVLSFASLSIRPVFLSIIDEHVLSLDGPTLRPAVKAIIMCLLPGIEDESSEDFDRTLSLLDRLRERTSDETGELGDQFFWQCFFLATISNPRKRQAALALLTRRLPKLTPEISSDGLTDNISYLAELAVTPEPGLLIRCFASGLEDAQPLVQRGFLDLLLSHLPLNSPVLSDMAESRDRIRLVTAAIQVVLRRDMSLNRRVWSWFLGPTSNADEAEIEQMKLLPSPSIEVQDTPQTALMYFEKYGLDLLTESIRSMLQVTASTASEGAKAYRICLALMDRTEIGSLLVPRIFIPAMTRLHSYKDQHDLFRDISRSASSFIDGIERGVIWALLVDETTSSLTLDFTDTDKMQQKLELIKFIASLTSVQDEETLTVHGPLVGLLALSMLWERIKKTDIASDIVLSTTQFVDQLSATLSKGLDVGNGASVDDEIARENDKIMSLPEIGRIKSLIQVFYHDAQSNSSLPEMPFSTRHAINLLIRLSGTLLSHSLSIAAPTRIIMAHCSLLTTLSSRSSSLGILKETSLILALRTFLLQTTDKLIDFTLLQALTLLLAEVLASGQVPAKSLSLELSSIAALLIEAFYSHLSSRLPSHHVEASRCLWQIDALFYEEQLLESSLASWMAAGRQADPTEHARRFATLWTQTTQTFGQAGKRNSLWSSGVSNAVQGRFTINATTRLSSLYRSWLELLERLNSTDAELQHFLKAWIESLSNVHLILGLLLGSLCSQQRKGLGSSSKVSPDRSTQSINAQNHRHIEYYLQQISRMLSINSDNVWAALKEVPVNLLRDGMESSPDDSIGFILAQECTTILQTYVDMSNDTLMKSVYSVQTCAATLLHQSMQGLDKTILRSLELDDVLLSVIRHHTAMSKGPALLQIALLDATAKALNILNRRSSPTDEQEIVNRPVSRDVANHALHGAPHPMQSNIGKLENREPTRPPKQLVQCICAGVGNVSARAVLSRWVQFLQEVLPLFGDAIFQSLIPLVEAFCKQIDKLFNELSQALESNTSITSSTPESTIDTLLTGLEDLLILAHQRWSIEESNQNTSAKTSDQPHGFFSNAVAGVMSSEASKTRSVTANSRLAVILCLQDAARTSYHMWAWAFQVPEAKQVEPNSLASATFISARIRNRAGRLLDRLFAIDLLESLEPLIQIWTQELGHSRLDTTVLKVVHVLDSSRPRLMMPALFNAIYSRTSPSALEPSRMSSMTAELSAKELALFLVAYAGSLDADAMEEIWVDCMAFLKDVLVNSAPQSQILLNLLEFMLILAEKVENTNFGEQRRLRKELSDTFTRLLSTVLTTYATNQSNDNSRQHQARTHAIAKQKPFDGSGSNAELWTVLDRIVPRLAAILLDNDRLTSVVSNISTNAVGSVLHVKAFPEDLSATFLDTQWKLQKICGNAKAWKKEATDLFNHSRLFVCAFPLVQKHLLPVIEQYSALDKDRLVEVLGRIPAPTSAGIVFGVGANAARQEADKKAQLNLRRACLLLLVGDDDATVPHLNLLEEKCAELISATMTSSPSSCARAEAFLMMRALILKVSAVHLSAFWSLISRELQKAIGSASPNSDDYDSYNNLSILQACKLLDLLILLAPDEFQLHEWLFITDTIDAVYRPDAWDPTSLVDELAEELGAATALQPHTPQTPLLEFTLASGGTETGEKRPLLKTPEAIATMTKEDVIANVLRPWFTQLSIHAFESTYQMGTIDLDSAKQSVLQDLFDDSTLIG